MANSYSIENLSSHLFWDVDKNALDFDKSKVQIIYKVLEFGLMSDWNIIKEVYGLETIKKISLELRTLDVLTSSYLSNLFKIDKSNFRCHKLTQSNQNFWNY